MASITYQEIYSRFYLRVKAYDLISLTPEQAEASQQIWLHMAASKPYIRALFNVFSMDDELETISFVMETPLEDEADKEFVLEILSTGMAMQWLEPQVQSLTNIAQMYGGKNEQSRLLGKSSVRCIWKHYSVFLRICWKALRVIIPKRKDEICLYVTV